MSVNATLNQSVTGITPLVSSSYVTTSDAQINISKAITDGNTDFQISFDLDVSEIKLFYMFSDVDVLVEDVANGSQTVISLLAGKAIVWTSDYATNLPFMFAYDLTDLFITNASGSTSNFRIVGIKDVSVGA